MLFKFIVSAAFIAADGSEAKPTVTRTWDNVAKTDITQQFESRLIRALWKMNGLSADTQNGKLPKPPATNPVTVRLSVVGTEDGALWSASTFEWPNMGEEQQAMMFTVISAELAVLPDDLKAKEVA